MTEVVISTEDVTVLGGPSQIRLDLEAGPPGDRGTFVFTGPQNPNTPEAAQAFFVPPAVFDLYVLSDPASSDYLQVYQYVNRDGELLWVESVKLSINIYSTTRPIIFTAGVGTVQINLSDLGLAGIEQTSQLQGTGLEFFTQPGSGAYINSQISISNFNPESLIERQLNPSSDADLELNPVVFTYLIGDIFLDEIDSKLKFNVTITAAELTQIGFVPVNDKALFVQMLVTVQDPSFIINFIQDIIAGFNGGGGDS
jgi:hypothetical protein